MPPPDSDAAVELSPRADARLIRACVILTLVLVPLIYSPLRHSDYVQDDHVAVEKNPIVARGDLGEIFATSYWEGANGEDRSLYRPVAIASYALERRIHARPDALLSHATNVALHLLTSLLLLVLLRRLTASAVVASATTLLFAVHPIHVEAVANVVGRAEILAALFSVGALILLTHAGPWVRGGVVKTPAPGRRRWAAWGTAFLFFLALGSKETALATAPLLVATEWLYRPVAGRRERAWWIERLATLAPAALAGLVYLILRIDALEMVVSLQPVHPFDNLLVELVGGERLSTALALLTRYVAMMFYPLRLSADYSGPVIPVYSSLLQPLPLLGLALGSGIAVLAVRPLLRPRPGSAASLAALGSLLFLLPYLVVGNLLFSVGTVFAERLMYLPSAGFCILLAVIIGAVSEGWTPASEPVGSSARAPLLTRRLAALVLALLVTGFSTLTWLRSMEWRDDETVFASAIRTRPHSPRAQLIVGKTRADRGENAPALQHYDRAIEHYPEYVAAWVERGVVLGRLGRLDEAETSFREAVRLSPTHAAAHLNLGLALRRKHRDREAERVLRRALLWDPLSSTAWASLGNVYLEQRRFRLSAQSYRRAIALGRADLSPRLDRAEEEARRGARSSAGGGPD